MKKLILSLAFTAISLSISAQTGFSQNVSQIQTAKSTEQLNGVVTYFSDAAAKTNTWQPYYYAALATVKQGSLKMREGKMDELDAIADKAEAFLKKSEELSPENAENYIVRKQIHRLRMLVNPQARFMSEGMLAADALSKAEKLDPNNPRITLLKAEDLYFTPEAYGGDRKKGIELFKKALSQFENYKTPYENGPDWGKQEAEMFLNQK